MKFKEISLNFTNPRRGFGTKSSESVHDASVPHVPAQTASKPPDTETKDPVSVDPPGEELNPDASVWRLYMLEAKDCDQELAKCRNANLDTMLIFAALFSAILTAFLIESTGLLQEDHAATSAALLLLIAQSQQRTEVGLLHGSSIPVTARPFVVAASARWVNGLWFVALALSLSAALLAITAKEWINEFIGSYAKAPHDFALERQARWDALESWRALHILDFLPTLLHVSLVCFALGLVIYLWLLDQVIAVVLALIIGVTAVLYLGTIFCGAVFELCPFVTRISVYLRIAIRAYTGANGKSHKLRIPAGEVTTARDLRALWWLMDNARDQTHRDCASRALVGLRSRRLDDISHPLEGLESAQDIAVNQSILSSIFIRLCGLVEQQLPTCPHTLDGPSTADDGSHAAALSELVAGTSSHSLGEFQVALESIEPRCNVLRHVPQPILAPVVNASKALLDSLENCIAGGIAFSADTHASLAAAELRLHAAILSTTGAAALDITSYGQSYTSTEPFGGASAIHLIDMTNCTHSVAQPNSPVARSLERYFMAAARTFALLAFHSTGEAVIGPERLMGLLGAIEDSAGWMKQWCSVHNQLNCTSQYRLYVQRDEVWVHCVDIPGTHGMTQSPLVNLVTLIGDQTTATNPQMELATLNALTAAWPLLTEPWVTENLLSPEDMKPMERSWVVPNIPNDLKATHYALKQMAMLVLRSSFDPFYLRSNLLSVTLKTLKSRLQHAITCNRPYTVDILSDELDMLIHLATSSFKGHNTVWDDRERGELIRILSIRTKSISVPGNTRVGDLNSTVFRDMVHSKNSLTSLLEILGSTSGIANEMGVLLGDLIILLKGSYLLAYRCFCQGGNGFDLLSKLGKHGQYATSASAAIIEICLNLSDELLHEESLVCLASAICFVLQQTPDAPNITQFVATVPKIMERNQARVANVVDQISSIVHSAISMQPLDSLPMPQDVGDLWAIITPLPDEMNIAW